MCYHRFVVRACVLVVAAALLAIAAAPVAARAPTVTIRARADLVLGSVRRTDDGQVVVRGTLRDRSSATGLGGQSIRITTGTGTGDAITRPDGSFEALVPAGPGTIDVGLAFAGSDGIDQVVTTVDAVDPSRAPIDLTVGASVTPTGILVTVTTTTDGVSLPLPVTIRITPTDADEPHRDTTGMSGQSIAIKRADALGPGARRITARFAGDAGHAAATSTTVIQLTSDTTVKATVPSTVDHDSTLRVGGTVTDADGHGVAKVTVTLLGDDKRRLGSAETGDDGRFKVSAEASLLGPGRHGLVVLAEPREAWLRASQSTVGFVTVGAPRPAPIAITIAAFAATALTAIGFIWARRRRDRRATEEATREAAPGHAAPVGGFEAARPSLVSTLRRAADHGFAGAVRESVRTRPLAGATVTLTLGAAGHTATTSDDGRFAFEALAAGEWSARVAAAGHVSERFTVTIPHRGELRGARVDLVPVRERAFAIYRSAALPLLPRPELWGIWSPRQIVDHVRTRRPPPALAALTSAIEELYFSGRVADESTLPAIESKATAAIAERTAGVAV